MLLNIQGSMYNLYDPEIATSELLDGGEIYFFFGKSIRACNFELFERTLV